MTFPLSTVASAPSDAEQSRLQELSWLRILDTPAEARFDNLTRLVADVFAVPIALVSLTGRDRQWVKSAVGAVPDDVPRELSFCSHALSVDFLEVPDARDDRRFRDNPFVLGAPFVRFYAGAVLHGPGGQPLGTLCLIDSRPRRLSAAEHGRLRAFAGLVEREINVERRDTLTGFFDAATVEDHLGRALNHAGEHGQSVLIMHLRLMNIDELVTLHGRDASDRVLRAVAERLREAVRHDDIIGRADDEGFVVVLPGMADSDRDAERIDILLKQLTAPIDIDGASEPPSLAAGVSRYPTDGTTVGAVMDRARTALAKVSLNPGEPAFRFYSQRSHTHALRKFEQVRRLADALAAEALDQVYQPFIDIRTGRITGFEALARWHDPVFGDVSPGVFVPLAEADPALSRALTSWSLDAACRQLAALNRSRRNHLRVSVNISGAQLLRHDFADTLHTSLLRHQVRADQVILELTEQSLLTNTDTGSARMSRLRADGVQFAVDDFGTGYSSLGYLKRLPLDIVKIDRCFVQEVADDPIASALTRGIIEISRTLGLRVIAEGIETEAEFAALSALNCDLGQGYLLGRPEPAQQLRQRLRERNGWD